MVDAIGHRSRRPQCVGSALAVPVGRSAAAVADRRHRAARNRTGACVAGRHAGDAAAAARHARGAGAAGRAPGLGYGAVPGCGQPADARYVVDGDRDARGGADHRRTHALSLHRGDRRRFRGDADVAGRSPRAARRARVAGGGAGRVGMVAAAAVEPRQRRCRPEFPARRTASLGVSSRWPVVRRGAGAGGHSAAAVRDAARWHRAAWRGFCAGRALSGVVRAAGAVRILRAGFFRRQRAREFPLAAAGLSRPAAAGAAGAVAMVYAMAPRRMDVGGGGSVRRPRLLRRGVVAGLTRTHCGQQVVSLEFRRLE